MYTSRRKMLWCTGKTVGVKLFLHVGSLIFQQLMNQHGRTRGYINLYFPTCTSSLKITLKMYPGTYKLTYYSYILFKKKKKKSCECATPPLLDLPHWVLAVHGKWIPGDWVLIYWWSFLWSARRRGKEGASCGSLLRLLWCWCCCCCCKRFWNWIR